VPFTAVFVGALVAVLGLPCVAGAATYADSKFDEHTVAQGLTKPIGATWAPDGRLLVVEKHGVLKTLAPGAAEGSTPTTALDLEKRVNDFSDRGLLGVAVDGQYPAQPFVYLAYTVESNPTDPDQSTPTFSRLVQVRVNPATGLPTNPAMPERVILGTEGTVGPCPAPSNDSDCIPSDGRSHSIGTVRSAPDGTLYLGSGDGSADNMVTDLALRALDERSMAGKIVHVDRDGKGLPGHSFCPQETDLTKVCTKVHAKGLRNPFRFHLRAGGGLTVGDVGWNTSEEVNLLDQPGANGGWPCHEAGQRTPGYGDRADCAPEYNPPTYRPPDFSYGHQPGVGGAVLGGPEYPGGSYPDALRDGLFYGDYAQGFIKYLARDSEGELVERPFATGWGGTDLELTPRGDLSYVDVGDFTYGTGSVKRIVYDSPVARISADQTFGLAPLRVRFDGGGSTAPEGQTLSYQWDFRDDGTVDSDAREPEHTYPTGDYTVRLTVRASGGTTATDTVRIAAGNTPPTARIDAPAPGAKYRGGQHVALGGTATDAQEGELTGGALQWQIKTVHREHTHTGSAASGQDASFVAPDDHDADSHLEVTLTATDAGGLSDSKTIRMDPQTAPLTLRSSPPGARVSWAGYDYSTPFSATTAVGFRTGVSAPESITVGGKRYLFSSWSDGGARLHGVTVPVAGVNLEARYRPPGTTPPLAPTRPGPPTPMPPAAAPGKTPAPVDRTGPRLSFTGFAPSRAVIAGRASDSAEVARVKLALLRRAGRRCRFFSSRRRGFGRPRSCRRPQLMTARLRGERWRLALGRALPVGVYRLQGSARDRGGNLTRRFSGGQSSLRLRVLSGRAR